MRIIAEDDAYAGLLISMHLQPVDRARRPIDNPQHDGLDLLDAFLERQRRYQRELHAAIAEDESLTPLDRSEGTIQEHFRLLQACDNLSLLTCVDFAICLRACCIPFR